MAVKPQLARPSLPPNCHDKPWYRAREGVAPPDVKACLKPNRRAIDVFRQRLIGSDELGYSAGAFKSFFCLNFCFLRCSFSALSQWLMI